MMKTLKVLYTWMKSYVYPIYGTLASTKNFTWCVIQLFKQSTKSFFDLFLPLNGCLILTGIEYLFCQMLLFWIRVKNGITIATILLCA